MTSLFLLAALAGDFPETFIPSNGGSGFEIEYVVEWPDSDRIEHISGFVAGTGFTDSQQFASTSAPDKMRRIVRTTLEGRRFDIEGFGDSLMGGTVAASIEGSDDSDTPVTQSQIAFAFGRLRLGEETTNLADLRWSRVSPGVFRTRSGGYDLTAEFRQEAGKAVLLKKLTTVWGSKTGPTEVGWPSLRVFTATSDTPIDGTLIPDSFKRHTEYPTLPRVEHKEIFRGVTNTYITGGPRRPVTIAVEVSSVRPIVAADLYAVREELQRSIEDRTRVLAFDDTEVDYWWEDGKMVPAVTSVEPDAASPSSSPTILKPVLFIAGLLVVFGAAFIWSQRS